MAHRFYIDGGLTEPTCELTDSEAHHLIHVMRGKPGDRVELFDGRGAAAAAEITEVKRNTVELRIHATTSEDDDATSRVILATAVPKGDRFRWLVEKATELGVSRLIPVNTTHSVVAPKTGKLDKMQQTVIAACKQCGRNRLMKIDEPRDWQSLVEREFPGANVLVADPSGEDLQLVTSTTPAGDQILVVGPEGGLTDMEISIAHDAGAAIVKLGKHILRIETAAISLIAANSAKLRMRPTDQLGDRFPDQVS